jgi:hypothetical protein
MQLKTNFVKTNGNPGLGYLHRVENMQEHDQHQQWTTVKSKKSKASALDVRF